MRTKIGPLLLVIVMTVLCGCRPPGALAPEDYLKWIADESHGLVQERAFDDLLFRLRYRPIEALALQQKGMAADSASLAPAIAERRGAYYFDLRIWSLKEQDVLSKGSEAPEDYHYKQYYFTSLVGDDLSLVLGRDTLHCALAHFERTYGTTPFNDLVMSFLDEATGPLDKDIRFIYNDRAFGVGRVEFLIRKEDILRVPALKLS